MSYVTNTGCIVYKVDLEYLVGLLRANKGMTSEEAVKRLSSASIAEKRALSVHPQTVANICNRIGVVTRAITNNKNVLETHSWLHMERHQKLLAYLMQNTHYDLDLVLNMDETPMYEGVLFKRAITFEGSVHVVSKYKTRLGVHHTAVLTVAASGQKPMVYFLFKSAVAAPGEKLVAADETCRSVPAPKQPKAPSQANKEQKEAQVNEGVQVEVEVGHDEAGVLDGDSYPDSNEEDGKDEEDIKVDGANAINAGRAHLLAAYDKELKRVVGFYRSDMTPLSVIAPQDQARADAIRDAWCDQVIDDANKSTQGDEDRKSDEQLKPLREDSELKKQEVLKCQQAVDEAQAALDKAEVDAIAAQAVKKRRATSIPKPIAVPVPVPAPPPVVIVPEVKSTSSGRTVKPSARLLVHVPPPVVKRKAHEISQAHTQEVQAEAKGADVEAKDAAAPPKPRDSAEVRAAKQALQAAQATFARAIKAEAAATARLTKKLDALSVRACKRVDALTVSRARAMLREAGVKHSLQDAVNTAAALMEPDITDDEYKKAAAAVTARLDAEKAKNRAYINREAFVGWQGHGYMTSNNMIEYMENVLLPYRSSLGKDDKPMLLIMDRFSAHTNKDVLEYAKAHGIDIALVPTGCTDMLQVLDVGVNRPFKHYARDDRRMVINSLESAPSSSIGTKLQDLVALELRSFNSITTSTVVNTFNRIATKLVTPEKSRLPHGAYKPASAM